MNSPLPDPLKARSLKLTESILAEHGEAVVPFHAFMQAALNTPGLGYYSAGQNTFDHTGDFTTAPHISAFFSFCLARQIEEILTNCQQPIILELGAGAGLMAADVLKTLSQAQKLPKAYWILEPSAALQAMQKTTIQAACPDYIEHVKWLDRLPDEPFEGIILGNEVLDAMPVHAWTWQGNTLIERGVQFDSSKQAWQWAPCETTSTACQEAFDAYCAPYGPFESGYSSEVNALVKPWLNSLKDCLSKGVMLWIDYGHEASAYYHPSRSRGTLMAYYQHQAYDEPIDHPGCMDITTHVNFSQVAQDAIDCGMSLLGYTSQMMFLASCGIEVFLQKAIDQQPKEAARYQAQVQQLMSPHHMGERFRVMALGQHWDAPLKGFTFNNALHRL